MNSGVSRNKNKFSFNQSQGRFGWIKDEEEEFNLIKVLLKFKLIMAKEIDKVLKLQVRGGAANPSPPVGPALGAAGVNIMEFCLSLIHI